MNQLQQQLSATGSGVHAGQVITGQLPKTRIEAARGYIPLRLDELWTYRELLYFFVWRDIKVRYRQTVMGVLWAIIQPVFTMVIFSLFFGRLAKIPSDGIPYPIFSYTALVPWTMFANSLSQAANSLVNNPEMIKKIYFPRLLMPASAILASVIDFIFAFAVLLVMMFVYGISPAPRILLLPLFLLLAVISSLGASLWLSALNVQFRDIRYLIPFLIQTWFFATPIAYSSSLVPMPWRILYGANPMTGVIEGFRWVLLGREMEVATILASALVAGVLLVGGLYHFRRMEKTFADVI